MFYHLIRVGKIRIVEMQYRSIENCSIENQNKISLGLSSKYCTANDLMSLKQKIDSCIYESHLSLS